MTLYVDGQQYDQRTMATPPHLIKPEFQFGDRHGSPFDTDDGEDVEKEAPGNGAIDAFATWNVALTLDQVKAVAETWNRVPADFADPIQDPTSGETAILTLGTLAEGSTFSFEHWDSGRMGTETSALLAGTETAWLNLYGITDGSESVGSQQSLLTRSTWLKVTGGSYNRIVGGRTNGHAGNISEGSGNGANSVTGNFNVQLSGQGTTARNIIGGFYGTGNGLNNDVADRGAPCSLNGDTTVVVTDGATVTGGIIGGSAVRFVAANETFTHDGSSSVTVRTILGAPNTNADHNVTAAGVKPMGIVGGDLNVDIGSLKDRGSVITGNTSVTVEIPSESGDFAMPIYGASVRATAGKAAQESFTQRVGGNSSVTIDAPDVTFSADIVAGGSGPSVTVAGAATLNLISGTFTGSLLPTANNASVTGAKELIIGTSADNEPTVDLSNARTIGNTKTTTATPFDTITVRTDLKLGTHRFTDTVIKSDDDTKVHNLTVTVTPEELAAMAGTHSETGGAYYPGAIDLGTLAGRGHVYGTVTFGDGSVIDVSGADRGFIAVDGIPTITAKADGSAGQVRILAPDDFVGEELQLFGWNGLNQADDVPPAGMTQESFVLANGTNGTLPSYDLEVRPSGVYMVNKTVVYDAANTKLTEVHDPMPTALYNELRMLATQEGKREVHVVAYTRGNTAFAKQWASVYAPQVFQGDGLYEFAQDGDRDVLKVSYEFGISRLWFSTDDTGTTQVNVTATLSSVDDTTGDLTFVPGSIVRLRAEKPKQTTTATRSTSAIPWPRKRSAKVSTR